MARLRRLRRVWMGAAAAAALVAAGCGGDADPAGEAAATGTAAAPFPATVRHALGEVTIEEPPQRVVTLGAADTQLAVALGATVVAAVANPAADDRNWPEVSPALGPDVTVLDSVQPNVEQIASVAPDLILATSAQPSYLEAYDQLSHVAPVVAYRTELLGDSGEELARLIGAALGEADRAEELIAASDRAIEEFAAAHPYLDSAEYVFGQHSSTTFLVVSPQAQSSRFLARLGMGVPKELAGLWEESSSDGAASLGMITPSPEQLDLLDAADIALISTYGEGAAEQFRSQPLVANLDLLARDRLHLIGQDLAAALLQPNPATTEHLLSALAPYLEELAP